MTFADIPVAAKLALVLLLPLLSLLGLAGVTASVYADRSGSGDLRAAVAESAEAAHVVDGLQRERLALARLLSGGGDGARAAFTAEAARTDAAVIRFRALRPGPSLDGLDALRARALAPDAPGQVLLLGYRQQIAELVAFQQEVADLPSPPAVGAAGRAAGWLAVGTEELALVQVTAVRVLAAGELAAADRDAIVAHRAAAASAFDRFAAAAGPARRAEFAGLDTTADVQRLLDAPPAAAGDTAAWARASLAQLDGLRDLADRVTADIAAAVADARGRQNRTIVLGLAVVLAVAAAATGLAVASGRSLRRRLRALLSLSLRLAHAGTDPSASPPATLPGVDQRGASLPGVDQRGASLPGAGPRGVGMPGADPRVGMHSRDDPRVDGSGAGRRVAGDTRAHGRVGEDPRVAGVPAGPRVGGRVLDDSRAVGLSGVESHAAGLAAAEVAAGRDEIGRVAEALDAVQRTVARAAADAAEAAAGQAALREGQAGMYTDLGRRAARLADALLERLDEAERDEADPDRLALLFALDHLATRIRHDTHSLLVLADADAARVHPAPVSLLDVLRAAQSQIHAYERVEYGRVDGDMCVRPPAVDHVVHLLAELLDNAARHSAGDRPVVVDARRAGDGAVVHVTDQGPGTDPAGLQELNGRLADPPPFGPRLGLTVVARLAARHGLDVALHPAPSGGLVATVRLPQDIVVHQPPPQPVAPEPVAPEPAARRLPPRPLERSPALPGGEPMDIPLPRKGGLLVPVVPSGVVAEGPTVEARAFDDGLPRRTVGASPHNGNSGVTGTPDVAESGDVDALPPAHRHPIGRFGAVLAARQEGHATS